MKDCNVFLVRVNMKEEKLKHEIFDNNQIGIHVISKQEKATWNAIINSEKTKERSQVVERWFSLAKSIKENDALIICTCNSKDEIKIGMISKGTDFKSHPTDKTYKIFQLENVKVIDKNSNYVFSSLIPSHTTISPIKKAAKKVIAKYEDKALPIELESLTDIGIEIICTEWLRLFAKKEFRLKHQLLRTGGNFPTLDIYGLNNDGDEVAAQVTSTSNSKTILKKAKALEKINIANKILFCNMKEKEKSLIPSSIQIVSTQKVFDDLLKKGYKQLLEKLLVYT